MASISMKSTVLAVVPETTEGTLVAPSAATQYTAVQGDLELAAGTDVLENAELRSSLGKAQPILGAENPTGGCSHYMRGSGVEGTAPDYNDLLKAGIGTEVVAGTEYATTSSSTTTLIKMASGAGSHFQRGQGMLLKHANAAWEVAIAHSIATDDVTPAFKLTTAPASGVNTGKCVLYKPADSGHQSLSVWRYLGNGGAVEALAGCRVTSIGIDAPAGQLVNGKFALAALSHKFNPIEITSSTKYLDFLDGSTDYNVSVATGWYDYPEQLADAVAAAMNVANAVDVHTCVYSETTGLFTITSANATFTLKFASGTNSANTIATKLGFTATNKTGAQTYTSATPISVASPYTPTLDSAVPVAAKGDVVYIGDQTDNVNFEASNVTVNWNFDRAVNKSVCATSGNSNSLITGREVKVTVSALLNQYDVSKYRRYKEGTSTRFLYVWGRKSGGNWVVGETMYSYIPTLTITSFKITQENNLAKIELEGTAFVDSSGNGEAYLGQL